MLAIGLLLIDLIHVGPLDLNATADKEGNRCAMLIEVRQFIKTLLIFVR